MRLRPNVQWHWIHFEFLIRNSTSNKIETKSILFNEVHFTCDNCQSTCVIIAQLPWRNAKLISIRFDSIDLQNWWFFGLTLLLFLFSQYKYTAIRSNTWPMQISLRLNLTPFTSPSQSIEIKMDSNSQQTQSPKIRTFQLVQKQLAHIGISSKLASQPYPLNGKILLGLFTLGCTIICVFKFTFYDAKTFSESAQSIYFGSVAIVVIYSLLIVVLKVEEIFALINDCENLVNTSKRASWTISFYYL